MVWLTSFWAENIEFIMGMYALEMSSETDITKIRHVGAVGGAIEGFAGGGG